MKRSLSRFLRLQKESQGQRLSSFAKCNGIIIPKRKQHGKEKMIFGKTTLTYLLANPNLEGEIHLKGVRFVTSLNSYSKTHSYHPCIHHHLGFSQNHFKIRSIVAHILCMKTLAFVLHTLGKMLLFIQNVLNSNLSGHKSLNKISKAK